MVDSGAEGLGVVGVALPDYCLLSFGLIKDLKVGVSRSPVTLTSLSK